MTMKLSFNAISATLATLGATTLVACGGANPNANSPVDAKEVPNSASGDREANCSASSCGADKSEKAGEGSCGAAGKERSSSDSTTATQSTEATAADSKSGSQPVARRSAPARAKPRPQTQMKQAAAAEASCGQGTCG